MEAPEEASRQRARMRKSLIKAGEFILSGATTKLSLGLRTKPPGQWASGPLFLLSSALGIVVAMMDVAEIEPMIEPALEEMGYGLVRVRMFGSDQARLQVMAERRDGNAMTVADCAKLSRAISAILDVEDPLPGSYVLEVSSPGMDRPLVRIGDFERFAGYEARIETGRMIKGRRRFRGKLLGVSEGTVRIALGDDAAPVAYDVPYDDIIAAKLVVTDAVIAESLKQREV